MGFAAEKTRACTATAGNDLTSKFLQGLGFEFAMLTQGFKVKGDRCTSSLPVSTARWCRLWSLGVTSFCMGAWDDECWVQKRKRSSTRRSLFHQPCHPNIPLQQLQEEVVSWLRVFPEKALSLHLPLPTILPSQWHYNNKGRVQDLLSRFSCSVLCWYFLPPQHLIHRWNKFLISSIHLQEKSVLCSS